MKPALFLLVAFFITAARADQPGLHRLDGAEFPRAGQGALVLMFWRADCPPCLVELRNAKAYTDSAGSAGQVVFVGLQDPSLLRRAAAKFSVPEKALAFADGDPGAVLAAYGEAPSLPVTVILSPSGGVCFRHTGLLGTDALEAGLNSCGGGDARH